MFERALKGGPVKGQKIQGQQIDTPDAGSMDSRNPPDPNAENPRGFVKNFANRDKPRDVDQPEGWKMGPVARMGMRRLATTCSLCSRCTKRGPSSFSRSIAAESTT